ncbi:uncharacterized protein LOC121760303 isoform X2 [Salvia splendens]|uniref:uncharacterized protein LOC121760303 isoform X2 n=1 Tax=Salvia splendens TaxID=180675 RepID=UPI001C2737FC|nr:uncharacterized protein LOC121760303 isoform X2 [Salvia splendens]
MMYRGLPDPYQGQEINRLTLAYFVISGLDIFAALDRIDCIAVSKKVSAVFFMLAAMFFAAAAAIAAVNANPKKEASGASWAGRGWACIGRASCGCGSSSGLHSVWCGREMDPFTFEQAGNCSQETQGDDCGYDYWRQIRDGRS